MANWIRSTYDKLSSVPGGRYLYSRALSFAAPYTGSIHPYILEVKNGYARVQMDDRRAIRNHLKCIHAIAMMNLAELTSGLAVHYALPDDARGILTGLSIEYKKKGRGTLIGESHCEVIRTNEKAEHEVVAHIRNSHHEVVAVAKAKWLIGPI